MSIKIPQIPLMMLPHDIVVTTDMGNAASDFETPTPAPHVFKHVRVEPNDQTSTHEQNNVNINEYVGAYTLYIDAVNSVNSDDYEIKRGDVVSFNGDDRKVITVDKEYALNNQVHHWEVALQ